MLLYVIKKEKGNPIKIYRIIKAKNRIRKFRLFDEKYYLNKYPTVKSTINPLDHYIYHGYKEKKIPSSSFDGNYYLKKYPDVKKSGENPLIHYVLYGKNENRCKNKEEENLSLEKLNFKLKSQKKEIKKLKKKLKKYEHIYKIKQINKEKVASEIENFKGYGIKKEKREQKLIISLTSYPDRMYDVHYAIYSLLTQTCLPDEVILWLSIEEFPNLEKDLPKKVFELKNHGLTIKWCKNLKSYKKLIPALKEYPNDIIVTADDDIYYQKDWLKNLYNEYLENKEYIICHRAHLVNFDNGKIKPYLSWIKLIQNNKPSFLNFPTLGGGVIYPPKIFYKDVLCEDIFMNLAPNGDDLWFWVMAILNNVKIKIAENRYNKITYVNPKRELNLLEEETLYKENKKSGNDNQIKNLIDYYPQIIEKLNKKYPKVSIIMPVYNAEKYLKKSIESVIKQTLKDIELICINDGSTDNSLKILEKYSEKDKRITFIDQKNQGAPTAINNGFKKAKGEYIGFVDADDWVDLNFFETLYNEAKSKGADIARTLYKYSYPNKEVPAKLNKLINKKYKAKKYLGINDHSVVNWNAIYRKKYLIENNIYYYDNIIVYDVPFTARTTYYSKKTVPIIGTYYHYRQEVKNQMTIMSLKRVKSVLEANKICLDFFNSVEYSEIDDYLKSFKRCMWRYDYIFQEALKLKEFDEKEQKEFFGLFVVEFKKCKFLQKFKDNYYEPYFEYMNENSFNDYLKYKKVV